MDTFFVQRKSNCALILKFLCTARRLLIVSVVDAALIRKCHVDRHVVPVTPGHAEYDPLAKIRDAIIYNQSPERRGSRSDSCRPGLRVPWIHDTIALGDSAGEVVLLINQNSNSLAG